MDPLPPSSHGDSNDCEEKESTSKKETDVVVTAVASLTDVSEDERSDEKDETSNGQEERMSQMVVHCHSHAQNLLRGPGHDAVNKNYPR